MKWNVGTKLASGFGASLAIFVLVTALSYQSIGALLDAFEQRKHGLQRIERIIDLLSLLKDLETGSRGYVITGNDSYLEPYQAAQREIDGRMRSLHDAVAGEGPTRMLQLEALQPVVAERLAIAAKIVEARRNGGFAAAAPLVTSGEGKAVMDRIRGMLGEMRADEERGLQEASDRANRNVQTVRWKIGIGTLVACLLAALVGIMITRSIALRLRQLGVVAERITTGDLSVEPVDDQRADEVGVLSRTLVRMTHSLRVMARTAEEIADGDLRTTIRPHSANDQLGNAFARMVTQLRAQMHQLVESANFLAAAAAQIVASTSQLAASASQSAAAVSQTTTTVEEVRQTAELASDKARLVADSAQKAALSSQNGRRATEDVAAGMARIREQMEGIGSSMAHLSEQGRAIGQIIASVEDLASQSKLLAVNAAIEAAKAGEHGRGFGVVAQEVKSLAEQSRQATRQVRTLLGEIQKATGAAVMATEQGGKAVEAGTRRTEVAGEAIQSFAASVSEAAQSAVQIAASSQQQMVGVEQVAGAMHSIRDATSQNVSAAQQMESAARSLQDLGQRLQLIVARYQLGSREAA